MGEYFIGEIRAFSYPTLVPQGWLKCDGALLPIQQHQALFSLLGTQFGGDGKTTFALPDLRGRAPIGFTTNAATNPSGYPVYPIGVKGAGGAETVALTASQVPAHTHSVTAHTTAAGDVTDPTDHVFSASGTDKFTSKTHKLYATIQGAPTTQALNANSISVVGAGASHNNVQPSLVLDYYIANSGLYPSRSY